MKSGVLGLRVDVCTYQGMERGVPHLLRAFSRLGIRATFFVAMGPDRSGRAVFRLWRRKGFLQKMLRTRGLRMYGLRTALYGTLLPAPRIAERCGQILSQIQANGHEVGIHSWDHVQWQDSQDTPANLDASKAREDYRQAREAFQSHFGRWPDATAAPAWRTSDESLLVEEGLCFRYASDTRGTGPFYPSIGGRILSVPQIPVTLPTLDELLGREGLSPAGFYGRVLDGLQERSLDVFAAHAEAEGREYLAPFEDFLERVGVQGRTILPLGELLDRTPRPLPACRVQQASLTGRAGQVSLQGREATQ